MIEVRTLLAEELDRAVDVLVPALRDAPVNEWMLGEWAQDEQMQRWLAAVQLIEPLRAGYVLGGFHESELLGVLAWSPPEPYEPAPEPEFLRHSIELLQERPQLRERLAEFQQASAANRYPGPHVALTLAGFARSARGTDLMGELLAPVFDVADATGVGVWMATATRSVGASGIGRFGGSEIGEFRIGPSTMLTFFRPAGARR